MNFLAGIKRYLFYYHDMRRGLSTLVPVHVFPDQKVIYVEVPKAGCTSIKWALKEYRGMWNREMIHRDFHMWFGYKYVSPRELQILLKTEFSEFKKMTVVRNPYHRFLSLYYEIQRDTSNKKGYVGPIDEYIKWFLRSGWYYDVHGCPQTYLTGKDLGLYDYVGRAENMNDVFEYLSNIFGKKILQQVCNAKDKDQHVQLPDKVNNFIYQLYKDDFKTFGYK